MLHFKKLVYEDTELIYSYLAKKENLDTDFAKVTLLCWYDELQIATSEEYVIIKYLCGDKNRFFSPLALNLNAYKKAIADIEEYMQDDIIFLSVNEKDKDVLESLGYESDYLRDYSEYLYNSEDLINLIGKKYHNKRNFINGFKNIDYIFRDYQTDDRDGVIKLMEEWNYTNTEKNIDYDDDNGWMYHMCDQKSDKTDYDQELFAVLKVLDGLEKFNAFCDVLIIDEKLVGFCIGEILPHNVGAIYFQKANIDYKGVYALIDNLFCRKRFNGVNFINKQEDLGISGLRKSKENYYPVDLLNKYTVRKLR